jgi:prepilin-type N-terminal cleavage/methylation domain-containing protein
VNAIVARMKRDDGLTLIEILISVVILGIIMGAIANALIVGFRTTDETTQRFSESHDAQIASATLAKDIQSAVSIADTSATIGVCGGGALISFNLETGSQVRYYYGAGSAGETQVTRLNCDGTGKQVLAHFATTSGAPTVTCDGIACNPGSRPKPNMIQISITEQSGYVYTLQGARRRWACAGGSDCGQPQPAKVNVLVLALGPGPSPGLFIGGSASGLKVNGSLMVNSSSPTAISTGGCTACIDVRDTAKILQGGGCSGCTSTNTVPAYPTGWGNYPSPIPDPLLYLPYPSKAGLPVNPAPTGTTYHPGVYTTPLQINNKQNNTMEAGIYILEQGMSISANGTKVSGTGVMLFNTCQNTGSCAPSPVCSDTVQAPSSPTTGGDIWVTGQSNLTLVPASTGLYNGVVLFQDRTSTHCMNLSGQSDVSSIDGTLYARTSYLITLGAGHAGMSVFSIIAPNLKIGGQAKVTVGPA